MRTAASIRSRVAALRRSLQSLDRALAGLAADMRGYRPTTAAAASRRRRTALSPKARAALKLQGQYMGYMRQLRPAQKALVRAVLAKSAKKAAIRKAQVLAGKRKAA